MKWYGLDLIIRQPENRIIYYYTLAFIGIL